MILSIIIVIVIMTIVVYDAFEIINVYSYKMAYFLIAFTFVMLIATCIFYPERLPILKWIGLLKTI